MRQATITELHDSMQPYLDAVEHGEVIHILKEGKHIADLVPAKTSDIYVKKVIRPLDIKNLSMSEEIIKDRSESR